MQLDSDRRAILWSIFAISAGVAVGWFFIPAFIIRPFTHQSARGLAVAMALRQHAPWGTLGAAMVCVLAAIILGKTSLSQRRLSQGLGRESAGAGGKWRKWGRKSAMGVVLLLVAFSTVMARLNYFEWMFHPVDSVQFEAASASKLGSGEMVLSLHFGSDQRAYPVREMAYHHIVNDVVGGVPVAVTY
jgi:hypothetical protein